MVQLEGQIDSTNKIVNVKNKKLDNMLNFNNNVANMINNADNVANNFSKLSPDSNSSNILAPNSPVKYSSTITHFTISCPLNSRTYFRSPQLFI